MPSVPNRFPPRRSMAAFLAMVVSGVSIAFAAFAAQPELVSTMEMMMADSGAGAFSIIQADDAPSTIYSEDPAPPQVFEIVRPDMAAFSVGRLGTSCACLSASMAKKDYAQGERALLEVRNIKPAPVPNALYAVFVRLTSPSETVLQLDVRIGAPAP